MKKILLLVTFLFTFTLAGCVPIIDQIEDPVDVLTEEEIEAIVAEYLKDYESTEEVNTIYDLQSFEAAIVEMLNEAKTGVLGVIATSDYSGGSGSGVVYKKEGTTTYYLITNEHVIVHRDEANLPYVAHTLSIVYEKNGLLFEVLSENIEILGHDETTDIAVLKFESDEDFNVIPFGDSNDIELGQFVYAIGNPLGFEYYGTITSGIISGLARYVQDDTFDATLLQHDAAISPGNSGGALLNSNGELIGINNMKIVLDDVSNIGFAIPSNTVQRIALDLEDDGEITRPYLGIQTYAQINACGLDYGVCVAVQEGGAADNAGLQDDDVIIGYRNSTSTEFIEIFNFNDLKEAILNSSVGEIIIIQYIRNGVTYESTPTELGVHPDDE